MAKTTCMPKNKLRSLRILNNYTQKKVAEELDIDQGAYSLMERGQKVIAPAVLNKIAEIFNTTPEEIVSGNEPVFANYQSNKGTQNYYENFVHEQKEVYEKLIHTLQQQIESHKKQIELLAEQLRLQTEITKELIK